MDSTLVVGSRPLTQVLGAYIIVIGLKAIYFLYIYTYNNRLRLSSKAPVCNDSVILYLCSLFSSSLQQLSYDRKKGLEDKNPWMYELHHCNKSVPPTSLSVLYFRTSRSIRKRKYGMTNTSIRAEVRVLRGRLSVRGTTSKSKYGTLMWKDWPCLFIRITDTECCSSFIQTNLFTDVYQDRKTVLWTCPCTG